MKFWGREVDGEEAALNAERNPASVAAVGAATARAERDALAIVALMSGGLRGRLVEIGTWEGAGAEAMARRLPEEWEIYTVDHYKELTPHETFAVCTKAEALRRATLRLRPYGNVQRIVDEAVEVAAGWPRSFREVDLLFIDDDHTEGHTVEVLRAWLPHMAPGGAVALHDHNEWEGCTKHPDVAAAASNVLPKAGWRHEPWLDTGSTAFFLRGGR